MTILKSIKGPIPHFIEILPRDAPGCEAIFFFSQPGPLSGGGGATADQNANRKKSGGRKKKSGGELGKKKGVREIEVRIEKKILKGKGWLCPRAFVRVGAENFFCHGTFRSLRIPSACGWSVFFFFIILEPGGTLAMWTRYLLGQSQPSLGI